MSCSECYEVSLQACPDSIILKAGLSASTSYYWLITDKFGNIYQRQAVTDGQGTLTMNTSLLGAGIFNSYAGYFKLEIRNGANYLQKVALTFSDKTYDCVQIKFEDIDADPEDLLNIIQSEPFQITAMSINFKKVGNRVKVEIDNQADKYVRQEDVGNIIMPNNGTSEVQIVISGTSITLPAITDIKFDTVPIVDQEDFEEKFATVFPEAGGTAITTLTSVQAEEMGAVNGFTEGAYYKVNGFLYLAISVATLSYRGSSFIYPDRDNSGNYSGIPAKTGVGAYGGNIQSADDVVVIGNIYNSDSIGLINSFRLVTDLVEGYNVWDYATSVPVFAGFWYEGLEASLKNNNVVLAIPPSGTLHLYAVKDESILDGTPPWNNGGAYVDLDHFTDLGWIPSNTPTLRDVLVTGGARGAFPSGTVKKVVNQAEITENNYILPGEWGMFEMADGSIFLYASNASGDVAAINIPIL